MSRLLLKGFRNIINNDSTEILFCVSVIIFSFLFGIFSPSFLYGKSLKADIILSDEERDWISEHPVLRVANELDWPPFDFAEDGEPKGYSIDLMNLIGEKTGLKLEFINGYTWSELMEKFKAGEIDIMPAVYVKEDRKSYISYTQSYYTQPSVIVIKKDRDDIKSLSDLAGKKLAVIEGFVITEVLAEKHPEIKQVPAKGMVEAIKNVSMGKVDAFIDSIGVISVTIEKNFIPNIKIISDPSLKEIENPALHIGVSRENEILRNILNKGLEAITREEMKAIREKWIPVEMGITEASEYDWKRISWLIAIAIIVFLLLILLIRFLTRFSRDKDLALSFGSRRFRMYAVIGLSLLITVVSVLGWLAIQRNKEKILTEVQTNLVNVLTTTSERLDIWVDQRNFFMLQLGRNPELVAITEQLLKISPYKDTLLASNALINARNFFETNENVFADIGFFIINPDHISIASMRDINVGSLNLIAIHKPELLERVFRGETVFVPPITSDVRLDSRGGELLGMPPTMLFAAPIRRGDGTIIAALAKRVDPARDFSQVLQFSRVGETGETYAFNQEAKLLSESRFDDDLRRIGLITEGRSGILNIEIRDPGGNMLEGYRSKVPRSRQPLNRMVAGALQLKFSLEKKKKASEHSAIETDMTGYRDYRGVPVFGAWQWDFELGMGMTSKIDVVEALSPYFTMRSTVLGVLGVTLFLSVGAALFVLILGERANRALSLARDNLEKKVADRTAALAEAEERSRLLLESAEEGIFGVGEDGLVNFINPAGLKMLGFKSEEVIGQKIHPLIHHTRPDGTPYPSEECPMDHSLTHGVIGSRDDEILWRKDGTSFPVEYTSVPIRKNGSIAGTVVVFRD
ncbi:MAG: transporter substrate-binding domain-containing protein, partial [Deltaproteobacteria bacterium]|nr:transporter substrate-binding domain-containing protein [Deltaproteobacteria bacterium]